MKRFFGSISSDEVRDRSEPLLVFLYVSSLTNVDCGRDFIYCVIFPGIG